MNATTCNLDEVTQVLKLYSRNLFVILSLSTPHSLSFSTKQRHFIKKTVCIQAHVDFISDCLTFRLCTPVWWWEDRWMCVYCIWAPQSQTCKPAFKPFLPRLTFSVLVLFFSCISRDRHAQSSNYITLDFTMKIPNNAAFERSRCISLRCQDVRARTFSAKLDSDKLSTAHSVYTQQSLAVRGKSKQ